MFSLTRFSIGRPGVDIHCTHDGEVAIFQVLFLINEVEYFLRFGHNTCISYTH